MLNFLSYRQSGVHEPRSLYNAEVTRRSFNLELSKHRDLDRIHAGGINTLDIDPVENRYLLSGGSDGVIVIHDLHNTTGQPKCTYKCVCTVGRSNRFVHKKSVETVQWYPFDSGMFTSSGSDCLLKIWDTNSLVTVDSYEFKGIVLCHDMSSCATKHSLVAVGTKSSETRLVDLRSGSAIQILKGHRDSVVCCKWSPREEFVLATGSEDNKCMLWDIRSAKGSTMILDQYNGEHSGVTQSANTAHSGHVNGLCYTTDGMFLVTAGTDNRLRLWSTSTGKNTLVNYGRIDNESWKCVKFSISSGSDPELIFIPDGNDIKILDMFGGSHIDTLRGHYKPVNSCVFHRTHQELYSTANDRNILIWTPDLDIENVCDDELKNQKTDVVRNTSNRQIVTADNWSSDED